MLRSLAIAAALLLATDAVAQADWSRLLYAHDTVTLRAAPAPDADVVRQLSPGDAVRVTNCEDGWCEAFSRAQLAYNAALRLGYVQQASLHPGRPAATQTRTPAASGRRYIRGPRGGCYYINSNGNRTYVDRSFCR